MLYALYKSYGVEDLWFSLIPGDKILGFLGSGGASKSAWLIFAHIIDYQQASWWSNRNLILCRSLDWSVTYLFWPVSGFTNATCKKYVYAVVPLVRNIIR